MSKELLDNVSTIETAIKYLKGNPYIKNDSYSMEALYYIEKALTPPTSDEVCEELNKWYSDVVDYVFIHGVDDFTYDEKNKRFYKRMLNSPHEMTICRIDTNGCMELREPLPPHLITLIGRFYQGVEAKK